MVSLTILSCRCCGLRCKRYFIFAPIWAIEVNGEWRDTMSTQVQSNWDISSLTVFFFVFFTALQCNLSIVRHLLDSLYWVKRIEPSGGDASNESQVHQYYMHVVSLLVIALTSWMRSEMPMMSYRCRVVTPISLVCFVAKCLTSANNNGDIYRVTWSCGIL